MFFSLFPLGVCVFSSLCVLALLMFLLFGMVVFWVCTRSVPSKQLDIPCFKQAFSTEDCHYGFRLLVRTPVACTASSVLLLIACCCCCCRCSSSCNNRAVHRGHEQTGGARRRYCGVPIAPARNRGGVRDARVFDPLRSIHLLLFYLRKQARVRGKPIPWRARGGGRVFQRLHPTKRSVRLYFMTLLR